MERLRNSRRITIWTGAALVLACFVALRPAPAEAQNGQKLLGGAYGQVKNGRTSAPLEGMMVQLVSHKNAMRTTVYSDRGGRFEFPKLATGWYALRIARPLDFKPYQKDSVWIEGGAQTLDDISLERIQLIESEFLPPTPEIMAQLSDSEWLFNLPGTAEEKKTFSNHCGGGCHTWQQSLRNRFDEKGWALMLDRMTHYQGRLLIDRLKDGEYGGGSDPYKKEVIAKFLSRVRGPNSEFPPMKAYPRPRGAATRLIITEYELPHFDPRPHDVVGDRQGSVWYTSNRSPLLGKLDPRTGVVAEYKVPITPGKHTGAHWIDVMKDGKLVFTESWSDNLVLFDPRTSEFVKKPGMGGNKGLAPDGYIWGTCGGNSLCKYDPLTAKPIQKIPLKKAKTTYGNDVSADGNFYTGGDPWQPDFDGVVWADLRTGEVWEVETPSGSADPSRGGVDPDGNGWMGGRGGVLVEFERKTHQVREFVPPTPYVTFYEAKPDKNGEIWAGAQRGGRMVRYNPKTDVWIEYQFPEPISLDWRTWVDNSTNPVTVWYGEHNGYLVRLQPLD